MEYKLNFIIIQAKRDRRSSAGFPPNYNKVKFIFHSIYRVIQYNRTLALAQLFHTDVDIPLTAANVHPVLDRVRSALLPVPP